MTHYILRTIAELGRVYQHKYLNRIGKPAGFPELEAEIVAGRIERFDWDKGKALRLTDAGKAELARLDAIPPAPRVPTAEQLRRADLVKKLQDNTITDVEVRELLRFLIKF